MVYRNSKCSLDKHPNGTKDKIAGPMVDTVTGKVMWKHEVLDLDGIVHAGEMIQNRQVL